MNGRLIGGVLVVLILSMAGLLLVRHQQVEKEKALFKQLDSGSMVLPPPELLPSHAVIRQERNVPEPPTATGSSEATSAKSVAPVKPLVPPPAQPQTSDAAVMAAMRDFAPELVQWAIAGEQLDKWVLMVDLMAGGNVPNKHRPLDFPLAAFNVRKTAAGIVSTDLNYQRASQLIELVTAIPADRLAMYYHSWRPVLEKSYRELGKPGTFDARLHGLIQRVLRVEPLPQNVQLDHSHVMYRYADPALEQRSALEKWCWRLGPDNLAKLQRFLRDLKQHL